MFRRHTVPRAVPLLASLVLASCGESPIVPGDDTGPLTAYLGGDPFIAESATVTRGSSEIVVSAVDAGQRSIEFRFPNQGDGNYVVGPGNAVSAEVTSGVSSWTAEGSTGSGTITVTGITSAWIEGEFSFTVVGGPSPASLRVTNGLFFIHYY